MNWQEVSFLQKPWIKKTAWIIANVFTIGNGAAAITGIVLTFLNVPNMEYWFARLIAICSILDFADGKLARISGSKKLAVDIDTIMDAFAFGLFPATFIGYRIAQWSLPGWNIAAGIVAGLAFLCTAWFRLYRFIRRDPLYTPYFSGLPSSFAAMVIACLVLLPDTEEWVIFISVLIVSGFMISMIPFPSFKGVPSKFDIFWIISTALMVMGFAVLPNDIMKYLSYGIAVYMVIYLIAGPGYAMKLTDKMKNKSQVKAKEEM
ncbi:MAG: hypothetical protein KGD64_03290 [Candidatus Heimdallarchaeota archaeon]|nr:hypothetical protein [Candidatus Heimdallarchaeota archaeon]